MGVSSNPATKPAQSVTAWFCKVGHHELQNQQALIQPADTHSISPTFPETARGRMVFTGGAIREAYADKDRRKKVPSKVRRHTLGPTPLTEWAFADAKPWGPAWIYPEPLITVFYRP